MKICVGPVASASARAWTEWAREMLAALRVAPVTSGLPCEVLDNIHSYLDAWAHTANLDGDGAFRWRAATREGRAISTARSVGLAGSSLPVSVAQSVVSHHIAALEAEHGITLIDRNSRPVRLAPAGEASRPHAAEVLGSVAAAEDTLRSLAGAQSGRLRIGAFSTACTTFLPQAMARFHQAYAGVEVRLEHREPMRSGVSVPATSTWPSSSPTNPPRGGCRRLPRVFAPGRRPLSAGPACRPPSREPTKPPARRPRA